MPKKSTVKEKVDSWILRNNLHVQDNYDEVLRLFEAAHSGKFNHQILYKTIGIAFIERNAPGDLIKTYEQIRSIGGVTKEKMILIYGEDRGLLKWEAYRNKQAETNTFEYKQKIHGYTREDFDKYNRSRAVTRENLILKYGEEVGSMKWNVYVERQAYAGCSVEYFIEKYGEEAGRIKFAKVNKSKSTSVASYMEKYGETEGIRLYEDRIANASPIVGYSEISQELFRLVDSSIQELNIGTTYYFTKNKEYGKMNKHERKYFFYDYVIPSIKFVMEFNGDIYHANPKTYGPDDIPKYRGNVSKTAKEIWEYDELKLSTIREYGFYVLVVWESDYRRDPERILNDITTIVRKRNEQFHN